MMKKLKIYLLIILALGSYGCSDDFFEAAPSDVLTDVTFWKTPEDFKVAVNALYPYLPGNSMITDDAMSDNAIYNRTFSAIYRVGNGSHVAMDFERGGNNIGTWFNYYEGIRRANVILDRIEDVSFPDQAEKDFIIAQAKFFRAFLLYDLAFRFGDVPLVTEPLTITEGEELTNDPRQEVMDFALSELAEAAKALEVSYTGNNQGRITKGAALGMLARFALYTGSLFDEDKYYVMARDAAKAVMDLGIYSLVDSYEDLFGYEGEGSAEIILANTYLAPNRVANMFIFAPPSIGGAGVLSPLRSLFDTYEATDGLPISESPLYDPENPYANRDPRLDFTLVRPGTEWADRTFQPLTEGDPDYINTSVERTQTGLYLKKYIPLEDRANPGQGSLDLIVLRYPEILLIYAEAKIELNEIDASVYEALNATRRRASVNMPAYTATDYPDQESLREVLRRERRVEFAFEGQRFYDVRRWKIAEDVMEGEVFGLDMETDGNVQPVFVEERNFDPARDYIWPIPPSEVILTEMEQNPKY